MMRIAIVGLGHVFEYQVKAISRLENIEIIAICDTDENLKVNSMIATNSAFYSDYKEISKIKNIDLVMISTSPSSHDELASYFIEKEITVLVEKPLTLQWTSCRNLISKSKGKLITAFHARYAEDLNWFLNQKYNIAPENVLKIKCNFYDPYFNDTLSEHVKSLGGSWFDSGVNALSVIERLICSNNENTELIADETVYFGNTVIRSNKQFQIDLNGNKILLEIDTDWTNCKNYKSTEISLYDGNVFLLEHSHQCVKLKNESNRVLYKYDETPRLVKHYTNLFSDAYNMWLEGKDNTLESLWIHDMLFKSL